MLSSIPRPVIFAHRGASSHAPENTLSAFRLARSQGAAAIELDVQLSADAQVVVFHDTVLERLTNGSGKLGAHTLAELKELKAGQAYGPTFDQERIPTLAEVLAEFADFPLINIELKNLSSPFDSLPEKVASLIKDHKQPGGVLVSSFNPVALARFHHLLPEVPIGLLSSTGFLVDMGRLLPAVFMECTSAHLSFAALSARRADQLHARNKLVFVYTLNRPDDMLQALSLGADGFFTDDPGLAIRTVESLKADSGSG